MNENKLLELKRRIDQSKSKVSELKGRRDGQMEALKKNWQCSSVEEGRKKIKALEAEITALEEKRDAKIKELEENFEL